MIFNSDEEVVAFLEVNLKSPKWIGEARKISKKWKALVNGEDFHELLIGKIEKIESEDRAKARKKYSKDIRSLFVRLNQPRSNVFSASGGEVKNDITSTVISDKVVDALAEFKGQKSIRKYMSETFFRLRDTDPNGVLFLEYKAEEDIYPTYKSIEDIHMYVSNGQLLEVIIFNPIPDENGDMIWRIVDDKTDWRVKQVGSSITVIKDDNLTFKHPFSNVPGVILSETQETGSEVRTSPLWSVEQDSMDYARDKSVMTIYKFLVGMPRHYRFESTCRSCQGTGKTGNSTKKTKCEACEGRGNMRKNDVTDVTILEMPREGDPIIAPNPEGFISPDLKTWERYKEDIKDSEDSMEATYWGTRRMTESTNETATGRFIDVQPVESELNVFTDSAEWTHNQFTNWVEDWAHGAAQDEHMYHTVYGRGYILETPEALLDKYNKSRESGSNNTILDKELAEYITAKYQNNTDMMHEMQKKATIEPYVHVGIIIVNDIFGPVEANKKILFNDFWEQTDKTQEVETLRKAFDTYFTANNKIKPPVEPQPSNNLN